MRGKTERDIHIECKKYNCEIAIFLSQYVVNICLELGERRGKKHVSSVLFRDCRNLPTKSTHELLTEYERVRDDPRLIRAAFGATRMHMQRRRTGNTYRQVEGESGQRLP